MGIEDFGSKATIEAFCVTVLLETAGLDELELDVAAVAPGLKFGRS